MWPLEMHHDGLSRDVIPSGTETWQWKTWTIHQWFSQLETSIQFGDFFQPCLMTPEGNLPSIYQATRRRPLKTPRTEHSTSLRPLGAVSTDSGRDLSWTQGLGSSRTGKKKVGTTRYAFNIKHLSHMHLQLNAWLWLWCTGSVGISSLKTVSQQFETHGFPIKNHQKKIIGVWGDRYLSVNGTALGIIK